MKVNSKSIVGIEYTLYNNNTNQILEQTPSDKLMKFKFGVGELLPLFEANIIDLKAGESFNFTVPAQDAYGPVDPYAIFDIPKDTFEVEGKIDEEMLQVGNSIPMTDDQGNKHLGKIVKLLDEVVTMDFNHPLAGAELRFEGKVIEVFE